MGSPIVTITDSPGAPPETKPRLSVFWTPIRSSGGRAFPEGERHDREGISSKDEMPVFPQCSSVETLHVGEEAQKELEIGRPPFCHVLLFLLPKEEDRAETLSLGHHRGPSVLLYRQNRDRNRNSLEGRNCSRGL